MWDEWDALDSAQALADKPRERAVPTFDPIVKAVVPVEVEQPAKPVERHRESQRKSLSLGGWAANAAADLRAELWNRKRDRGEK